MTKNQRMAAFHLIIYGRFWVITEVFVLFLAKRMSQLVVTAQVEKVVHAKRPLPDQLQAPRRDRTHQRLLEERLPPVQNRKRRAVGSHPVLALECLQS